MAFFNCSCNVVDVSGRHTASMPCAPCTISILPRTISGCPAKYWFIVTPSLFSARYTHSGVISATLSRFLKNSISVVVSVPAFSLNAVTGSLTAPASSALCAKYFLALALCLSIVPFDVINAAIPPGLILSSVFARK